MTDKFEHVSKQVKETFEVLERSEGLRGKISGLSCGFGDIDKMTSGLHRGELVLVASRPAMGKTILAMNMMVHVARVCEEPVIMFSLGMSRDMVVRRMMAAEGQIDMGHLRTACLTKEDWPRAVNAANALSQTQIHLDDGSAVTPAEVWEKCMKLKKEKGLSLVVVDCLQMMRMQGGCECQRTEELSRIARDLKSLALELDVPILLLSGLDLSVESRSDKRPMVSDLRRSGTTEQHADVIMFIYRDEVYNPECHEPGVAEILIAKQRSGPTGTVKLRFVSQYTRFDDYV